MKKKSIVLFWLGLAAIIQAVPAQDKHLTLVDGYAKLSSHIDKAKVAFRRDDLARCEKEVLFCLDRLPDHQEAHFLMSQVLYKRGEYEKALAHVLAAEEGYLRMAEAISVLEQLKLKKRADNVAKLTDDVSDFTAADAAAKARGSCQPDRNYNDIQGSKDDLAKEQAGRIGGDAAGQAAGVPAEYHYAHGNCLFQLRRMPEAESEYVRAIKSEPSLSEAYNNLINLLFMEKRVDEARAFLSQAEAHKAKVHPGLKKAVLEAAGK
jgi:tetratricopeptide (TPR) repeat protein